MFAFDLILAPFSALRTNEFVNETLLTMLSAFFSQSRACVINFSGALSPYEEEDKKKNKYSLDLPPTDPIESP